MFKGPAAFILAIALALGMGGCGESNSERSAGIYNSKNVDGTYLAFDKISKEAVSNASADELLEKAKALYDSISSQSDIRKETARGSGKLITLDEDGKFVSSDGTPLNGQDFSGSYRLEDGKIKFRYEKYVISQYGSKGNTIAEWDKAGFNYFDEPIVEEYKLGENANDNYNAALIEMNETGTYFDYVGPKAFFCQDMAKVDWTVFPLATGSTGNMTVFQLYSLSPNRDDINSEIIEKHGDFLCTKTAGWKLDGDYTAGKDFSVEYTVSEIFDDWYNKEDEVLHKGIAENDFNKRLIPSMEKQLGISINDKTKIEFSDGKWKWLRSDGSTISQGTYSESAKHEGFIVIRASDNNTFVMNEYIYIEDGNIYYPYWIKIS